MNEKLYKKETLTFLRENRLATFSTFSHDSNYPESALVYYLVDGNNDILHLTTSGSRKLKNIEKSNKVAFLVGQEVEPIVVQIQGTAEVITNPKEINNVFGPYLKSANDNPKSLNFPPLTQLSDKDGVAAIKIKIDKMKYSNFSGKKPIIFTDIDNH